VAVFGLSREVRGDWVLFRLQGDFVLSSLPEFRAALTALAKSGKPKVALDMHGVQSMDSSAINLLNTFAKNLSEKQGALCLFGALPDIAEVLSLVHFGKCVTLFSTQSDFEKAYRL
jgi:anti-anti-sigma factor